MMCEMKRLCSPSKHRENIEEAVPFGLGLVERRKTAVIQEELSPEYTGKCRKQVEFDAIFYFSVLFFPCRALLLFLLRAVSRIVQG